MDTKVMEPHIEVISENCILKRAEWKQETSLGKSLNYYIGIAWHDQVYNILKSPTTDSIDQIVFRLFIWDCSIKQ